MKSPFSVRITFRLIERVRDWKVYLIGGIEQKKYKVGTHSFLWCKTRVRFRIWTYTYIMIEMAKFIIIDLFFKVDSSSYLQNLHWKTIGNFMLPLLISQNYKIYLIYKMTIHKCFWKTEINQIFDFNLYYYKFNK